MEVNEGVFVVAADSGAQSVVPGELLQVAAGVRARVAASGLFGEVRAGTGLVMLVAAAKEAAAPAEYRLEWDQKKLRGYVSLVMADRWLSESIESHLVEHGDKMEELLEDELVEVGYFDVGGPAIEHIEHFRSDDKLFTFRAKLPVSGNGGEAVEITTRLLLGFEMCFRQLGDMEAGPEGES